MSSLIEKLITLGKILGVAYLSLVVLFVLLLAVLVLLEKLDRFKESRNNGSAIEDSTA
jgi:ABC-type Na+ efflux pump permease subunit